MAGTSQVNQTRLQSTKPNDSNEKRSASTTQSKSEGSSIDRQSSNVNKVDVNSSKTSNASNRISDSQIADGKFKATSETSVGALAQKLNDDGQGNVDSKSVKTSVRDIVENNSELKKAASELDPNDPDYDQKLADLKIKEGEELSLPEKNQEDLSSEKEKKAKKSEESNGASDAGASEEPCGSGGCGDSKGPNEAGKSDAASGNKAVEGKKEDSSVDLITQLIQSALQAITSKDKDAATQILALLKALIEQLQNAAGDQQSSKPSEDAKKSADKINSGKELSSEDTSKISDIVKNASPQDKIAVLEALSHRLEAVANSDSKKVDTANSDKNSEKNKASSDPLSDCQANYNMASINISNSTKNKLSNIKVSGNAQVTIS